MSGASPVSNRRTRSARKRIELMFHVAIVSTIGGL
jgi:hypothetical protein